MNADWPSMKISDVAVYRNNKRIPLKSLDRAKRQGIYPYYGASGVVDYIDDYIFNGTYLLISEDGENLRSRKTPVAFKAHGKFWVNNHAHILEEKEEGILDYLEYYFSQLDLTPYITGAVQPKLNKNNLDTIEIPIPPLEERRAINGILNSLTYKIDLNHQTNQTLEQMAQAIFKSWFVDFEPVKAKMAALEAGGSEDDALLAAMQAIAGSALFATDAADADAPTQLARLQAEHPEQYTTLRATAELFPSAMQDSELGEIPEGWEAKPFGELLIKTIGGDWGKDEPDEKHTEKVKILRGTDLPHVYAGYDDKVPTRYVDPKKLATRKLENGDIVIEVSGGSPTQPTGRSLYLTQEIINRLNADLEPASFCRLFRPESKETGLILGLHLQKIYGEGKTWLYQNTSTGISNFQTKMFLEKELLVIPPNEIQQYFFEMVMPYLQKMSNGENKILAELRDTLLPKLLSGELSISAATDQITQAEEAIDV